MATRFAPSAGGLSSGTLFAPVSAFTGGVSGTMAAILANDVVAMTGQVTQFWVEPFDITVNLAPTYFDTYYAGTIGTMAVTLADAVLNANEAAIYSGPMAVTLADDVVNFVGSAGLPNSGTMNVLLANDVFSASGSFIVPITGTMSAVLADAVFSAGLQFITKKTFDVRFTESKSFNIHVR